MSALNSFYTLQQYILLNLFKHYFPSICKKCKNYYNYIHQISLGKDSLVSKMLYLLKIVVIQLKTNIQVVSITFQSLTNIFKSILMCYRVNSYFNSEYLTRNSLSSNRPRNYLAAGKNLPKNQQYQKHLKHCCVY